MIPEQTIEALRMGFGHLGSASSDLKCAHIDTLSTSLEKDKDTITCFVLSSLSEKVLENFKSIEGDFLYPFVSRGFND